MESTIQLAGRNSGTQLLSVPHSCLYTKGNRPVTTGCTRIDLQQPAVNGICNIDIATRSRRCHWLCAGKHC